MRLAYVIELVAVIAAGLALGRWHIEHPKYGRALASGPRAAWFEQAGNGVLAGTALVGSAGLLVEVARRRTPRSWGPGRWAWSIVALYLLARLALLAVGILFYCARWGILDRFPEQVQSVCRINLSETFLDVAPCFVAAAWVTLAMSRTERSPADGREWGGRILGGLVIAAGVVLNAVVAAGI